MKSKTPNNNNYKFKGNILKYFLKFNHLTTLTSCFYNKNNKLKGLFQ